MSSYVFIVCVCDMPQLGHGYSMWKKKICFLLVPDDIAVEQQKEIILGYHSVMLYNIEKIKLFVILKCVLVSRK